MNDRDTELARQAGFIDRAAFNHAEQLKRFAALIREDEREACALMADDAMCVELADQIRARGNK